MSLDRLIFNVNIYIIRPIIILLFVLAALLFFFGLAKFILNTSNGSEEGKEEGLTTPTIKLPGVNIGS